MGCKNRKHWDDYDPNCNLCENEMRELVKSGTFTQKEFDSWIRGVLKIGLKRFEYV